MSYKTKDSNNNETTKHLDESWKYYENLKDLGQYENMYFFFSHLFAALDSMEQRIAKLEQRPVNRILRGRSS